jgi:putative membrane protein
MEAALNRYASDSDERDMGRVWKGAAAGLAGGLIATWAMGLIPKPAPEPNEERVENATVNAASAISEGIADHRLTSREKKVAGPLVHYAFGTAMGAAYGAIAELWPSAASGWGLPFGAALWMGADEVAVPSFGLGSKPTETRPAIHGWAFGAHLVYGLTTDTIRRGVRAII